MNPTLVKLSVKILRYWSVAASFLASSALIIGVRVTGTHDYSSRVTGVTKPGGLSASTEQLI